MQSDSFDFPQYRKYLGIDTYYKIESDKRFIEISKVGSQTQKHIVEANQYPEMLRIQDMLSCLDNRWELITEKEYLAFENQ